MIASQAEYSKPDDTIAWRDLHLHPEHEADLQKSGLTPTTARELNMHTVPPRFISKHMGCNNKCITSLLCFPYPGEGGFCRDKVFPADLKDKNGNGLRYLQRPGTGCRLYIPPLAGGVLRDRSTPLRFTEGEKKAAKACQEGYLCIGLGGLWNFSADGKLLPRFEDIVLERRRIILVPDSEMWTARKDLLVPVYRLGKLLEERGASVEVEVLSLSARQNTALDDFLVAAGDQAPTALNDRFRVLLTDKRFRFVARQEERRRTHPKEEISAKEALKEARRDLEFLLQEAEADPDEMIREVLGYPDFIRAFALVANRERGVFEAALLHLRALRVKDRDVKALERAVNAERRKQRGFHVVESDEEPQLPTVKSILPAAPVSDAVVFPPHWRLSTEGVAMEQAKNTPDGDPGVTVTLVAPSPIVIAGRLKDITDSAESLRLAWHRDGRWQTQTTSRVMVANARQIVELADVGFPVTSGTSSDIVRYLAEFEATNMPYLPRAHVSKQMGWQGEGGKLGFLWGRRLIRPDGEQAAEVDLEALHPEDWREDFVAFRGADAGDEQLADGFHAQGTYEGWIQAVTTIAQYPRVLLAFYMSLTPVILTVIEAPNFFADWCGPTSLGKTTTLRVAASVWGCPDERVPAAALGTWDATRVWIERASTVLNNLPLILDDTKRARYPKAVAQTLYDIASGRGRGRGSLKGMRRAGSWATVGLFSGEAPAVSFTEDSGTRTRGLTLWGSPFGTANETTAAVVSALNLGILQNYGHTGPRFAEYVVRHRDQWEQWRCGYQLSLGVYRTRAGVNPVGGRMAAYFAALDQTADIAHEALALPWEHPDPIAELWEELTREASEADRAKQALAIVVSWAHSHGHEFWCRHQTNQDNSPRVPSGGWAGKWQSMEDWETIAFFPHKLTEILKAQGFEADAILRTWRDREWLEIGDDRNRYQKKVSIDGNKTWAVVIKRRAIEEDANDN